MVWECVGCLMRGSTANKDTGEEEREGLKEKGNIEDIGYSMSMMDTQKKNGSLK